MKKRGDMTIGMIIAIALGVLMLVLLVFGVSSGFGGLWEKVRNIGGTDTNIDSITTACQVACDSNNEYGYCTQERSLKFGSETCFNKETKAPVDCNVCDDATAGVDCINTLTATCNDAETYTKLSCSIC